jgi:hypothetical protein
MTIQLTIGHKGRNRYVHVQLFLDVFKQKPHRVQEALLIIREHSLVWVKL